MNVLVVSIVEPDGPLAVKGGATTVTRGLVAKWREECSGEVRVLANRVLPRGALRRLQLTSLARAAVTGRPSKVLFQERRALLEQVEASLAEGSWDRIVVNGSDLWPMVRRAVGNGGPPIWIVVHNVEGDLFQAQIEALPASVRPIFRRDLAALRREEKQAYCDAERLLFLCQEDADRVAELYPESRAARVIEPVRFEGRPFHERASFAAPAERTPLRLGMLGDFGWWPNAEGAVWFHETIWPALGDQVEWHLYGRGSEDFAAGLAEARIAGHGVVGDLDELWRNVDLMVCPVLSGGGVRIKNAEAVWNGVPLLTNALGMRGVDRNGPARVIVEEEAADWIEAIGTCADNRQALRTERSAAAA